MTATLFYSTCAALMLMGGAFAWYGRQKKEAWKIWYGVGFASAGLAYALFVAIAVRSLT